MDDNALDLIRNSTEPTPSVEELKLQQMALLNNHLDDLKMRLGVMNEIHLELLDEVRRLGSANFGAQARPVRHIPPPSRRLFQ